MPGLRESIFCIRQVRACATQPPASLFGLQVFLCHAVSRACLGKPSCFKAGRLRLRPFLARPGGACRWWACGALHHTTGVSDYCCGPTHTTDHTFIAACCRCCVQKIKTNECFTKTKAQIISACGALRNFSGQSIPFLRLLTSMSMWVRGCSEGASPIGLDPSAGLQSSEVEANADANDAAASPAPAAAKL
jgi:hypothetical protein